MGRPTKQRISLLFFVVVGAREIPAQTAALALTSTSVAPGAAVSLNLTLSGGSAPAGLQWTLMPPAGGLSGVTIAAGPALAAAGKALQCSTAGGTYTCLASGLNTTQIRDGVVALVSGTASTMPANITIGLDHTVAASPAGKSVASTGAAGTILIQAPISLSQLSCVPSSLVTPSSSTCTVTLSAAAPAGGTAVALSSDNVNLAVTSSVAVPAGANSADFNANASTVSISQNATVTAMLSGTSRNAVIALAPPAPVTPPVVPMSLACDPASLVAGPGTCTVILSGLAPSGGATVSLVSSNAALAVPPSLAVPAGTSSASFTFTGSGVTSSQTAVITAFLGGSSITNSVVLNAAAVLMGVGPGASYASPCAALSAAPDGAHIRIDAAGSYIADVCTIAANNLIIEGVHGRPRIDAAGMSSAGQAAWVFQGNNISIDNVEITGAASAANSGAAILTAGTNLKVVNSNFHDNQAGLVTVASSGSQVLIQATEFSRNGFGDGFTHNVDIGAAARLTMQYCYSHDANGGDLAKSQASENFLLFNRLTSELGTTNTELDLTHGGRSFLIGNLIEKSPSARGGSLVGYLLGGVTSSNPSSELYVVNNTFVNDKGTAATFLNISAADSTPALVTNNIFYGAGAISTQTSAVLTANLTTDPFFANRAEYDYRLTAGSPAIDAGVMPSPVDGVALLPAYQYLHPSCGQTRNVLGAADIGAYEFSGAGTPLYCALAVSGIAFSQNPVVGGAVVAATVTLGVPAPSAGILVALTSSNPAMAAIPASVTIPSGATSATFSISTAPVSTTSTVTISASYSGGSQTASLILTAPPVALASFGCSPVSLTSGATSTCTVTLSGTAPSGGATVTLSSNSTLLTAAPSVTIAAGSTSATFQAKAGTIPSNQSAILMASFAGVSRSVTVALVAPASLAGLVCSPTTLTSYSTSTCTVTLSGPAPAGGTAVALSDNSKYLSAPHSVTVPAGALSAGFSVRASRVRWAQRATLTAKLGAVTKSVTFQLMH